MPKNSKLESEQNLMDLHSAIQKLGSERMVLLFLEKDNWNKTVARTIH